MDQPKKRQAKPKKTRTRKEKVLRGVYIGVTAVAALVVVLFVAYRIFAQKPKVEALRPGQTQQEGEAPGSAHSNDRKKDFYTFLVVGRDTAGGGNTDTMLLAAYDIPNQKLNVMSIPRDTLVNINADIKKINAVYNYGGGGDKGIAALNDEISELMGFVPDFQVVVEWKAVGELVDALGGVWYDVPRNMDYEDPYQDLSIHVPAGYQKLDGGQAMGVVRYRSGYNTGDLGRIETQQGFLKAVVEQCLKIQNVTRIGELAKVFNDNVTTNLTVGNLAWFAEQAIFGGLKMENVNFVTMPWVNASGVWSRTYHNHPSYVAPDVDALVALVNESFNPFAEDVDKTQLDIMYVNDDGTLGCTGGKLADGGAYNEWLRSGGPSAWNKPAQPQESQPVETPPATEAPEETPAQSGEPTEPPAESPAPPAETAPAVTDPPAESAPPAESGEPTPTPPPAPTPDPNAPPEGIPIG